MTREEAINKWIVPAIKNMWNEKKCEEIMQALEQEPILDKIRAEIQKYADNKAEPTEMRAYYHCLQIIDKFKAESEDKEKC